MGQSAWNGLVLLIFRSVSNSMITTYKLGLRPCICFALNLSILHIQIKVEGEKTAQELRIRSDFRKCLSYELWFGRLFFFCIWLWFGQIFKFMTGTLEKVYEMFQICTNCESTPVFLLFFLFHKVKLAGTKQKLSRLRLTPIIYLATNLVIG